MGISPGRQRVWGDGGLQPVYGTHPEGCRCTGPAGSCIYEDVSGYSPAVRKLHELTIIQHEKVDKQNKQWKKELLWQQAYEEQLRQQRLTEQAPQVTRGEPLGAEGTVYRIYPSDQAPQGAGHYKFVSGSFDVGGQIPYFETTNRSLAAQARENIWLTVKKLERSPEEVFAGKKPETMMGYLTKIDQLQYEIDDLLEQADRLIKDAADEADKQAPDMRVIEDINSVLRTTVNKVKDLKAERERLVGMQEVFAGKERYRGVGPVQYTGPSAGDLMVLPDGVRYDHHTKTLLHEGPHPPRCL